MLASINQFLEVGTLKCPPLLVDFWRLAFRSPLKVFSMLVVEIKFQRPREGNHYMFIIQPASNSYHCYQVVLPSDSDNYICTIGSIRLYYQLTTTTIN